MSIKHTKVQTSNGILYSYLEERGAIQDSSKTISKIYWEVKKARGRAISIDEKRLYDLKCLYMP